MPDTQVFYREYPFMTIKPNKFQGMTMDFPLDEFFFGNPAAWAFENLWNID